MLTTNIREQVKDLPAVVQNMYERLVLSNHDVFSASKQDLGQTNIREHSIKMQDESPSYITQFRIPQEHWSVLIEHLNNWLKLRVVSPSRSHDHSPIFCVPKEDGTLRPVLDFRAVNNKSFIDKYSQREVQDCIDEIG